MVDAAKTWNADHPEAELIFAQGTSGTDDEGEIAAIESMITQGGKAIVITPTSPNVQDALQKAVDGGIKVILVDNDIPGWDGKTALVATDNLAGGVLAGKYLASQLKAGDTVAILEGVAGAPSLQQRVDGFKTGLGDGFTIVASLPTDCDQTKRLNAAQDILTANPDVTAIYGACGPPILGAIEAVASAGKKTQLVGFDAGQMRSRQSSPVRSWHPLPSSLPRWAPMEPKPRLMPSPPARRLQQTSTRARRWSPRTMLPTSAADIDSPRATSTSKGQR